MNMGKVALRDNKKAKIILRVVGFTSLAIGLGLAITAFVDFFVSISSDSMKQPQLFWMFFVGFPLIFIGISCLSLGFLHATSAFLASEQAPVAKDVTNYMLDGTREETAKTAEAISNSVHPSNKGFVCPRCHTQNEVGALFCDNCGESLTKTCSCGEVNDIDAHYCRKCGKPL